ncbi:HEAT repeat domain-containing protein [Marinicella litoralis]|uniref:HEAT repeat protein n=1 Tax=Marinicella litoralis TaxID=644220 RepID=A0A4V3DIZ9_9GAMM|nr:HEAT repeat domain-containing protein [Marinicella litoralis]TDR23871.1 HEAT repeat protein [Marinicella litoralis]
MKKPMIYLLLLATSPVWSNSTAPVFKNLNVNIVSSQIQPYVNQQSANQWFAYSVPATENTASMCCFNQGYQAVCDLNKTQHGFGSSSQSPTTENIHVFVHLNQGKVTRIMPVGDYCEVTAKGLTIDWLDGVSGQQSIQWLKDQVVAEQDKNETGGLYALSLHQGKQAAITLFELAEANAGDTSEQAVFWLGQRQQDGFAYLKSLYQDMPVGEIRRKVNFALSQNQHEDAVKLLQQIAQHDQDQEQQLDAIFWLSQADDVADLPAFLLDMLNTSDSANIKEKTIFSLSQINNDEANQLLVQLVKDHKEAEVREKALFWLAQNNPQQAKKAALNLLKAGGTEAEQENAVFVLSQLPAKESAAALFNIVRGNFGINIKKKAIFWLSQSDDADTLEKLAQLL